VARLASFCLSPFRRKLFLAKGKRSVATNVG
jgi:hypothetical protein